MMLTKNFPWLAHAKHRTADMVMMMMMSAVKRGGTSGDMLMNNAASH